MGKPTDTPTPEEGFTTLKTGHIGGSNAADVIDVAQQAVEPVELDIEKVYALRTADGGIVPFDLERFRETPDRARGTYKPATVVDFVDYVGDHATAQTTVWVHPTEAKVVAVVDDHGSGVEENGWGEHLVELGLIVTPEWLFWKKHDGQMLNQWDFAEKIEDGLSDVVEPTAAQMLEVAKTLHVKNHVNFRSGVDLTDGSVKFKYDEQVEGSAGQRGEMAIPEEFVLGLAPFIGEDKFRISARFRYRPQGGKLQLGYKLQEPERAERTVLEDIAKKIREGLGTSAKVFLGGAPALPPR